MREATIRDAAYAARVAYKAPARVDNYLAKWNTPFKLEASHRLHHHNIYVLRDTTTGQLHVTASGSDNLHNWTRNLQRGAGDMPTNIVESLDVLLREIKADLGEISSVSSHSGFCPYMSESTELRGVQKVFFNPDNVIPDVDTLMVAGKQDPLTRYNGQRQNCVILEEGKHGIKDICGALDQADLGSKPLSAATTEFGYGNQILQRPDGRLVPDHHRPQEKIAADRAFKARKHELYEDYRRRHPSEFDDRKGHPKDSGTRQEMKDQARRESINSADLQDELARLRGHVVDEELPPPTQAAEPGLAAPEVEPDLAAPETEPDAAEPAEGPGNVEVGSRESTAVPPTMREQLLDGVGGTFIGAATSAVVGSLAFTAFSRWWWPEEVKRRDTRGKVVIDSVVTGATAGGIAAGVRVVGNGLASVGMLTSSAVTEVFIPGVLTTFGAVGQVYSLSRMAIDCLGEKGFRPTSVTLTAKNRRALQPVAKHSRKDIIGATGEAIRARQESRRRGEPTPSMGDALYDQLSRKTR